MGKNELGVYKSQDGRRLIHDLYRKHLLAMPVQLSERMVETSFGDTHVVYYGQPNAMPVLCFNGRYVSNPLIVKSFAKGMDMTRIQLVVPDLPGSAGFSAEKRLRSSKGEYGQWAMQVMDGLGLHDTTVLGYSFGAHVALQLCAAASTRVKRLMLVSPSDIANASSSRIEKLAHLFEKEEKQLTDDLVGKTLQPILSFPQNELVEMVRLISQHMNWSKEEYKDIKKKDLQKFQAPVGLFVEKSDYLFPGEAIMKRARKVIPNIEVSNLMELGCHCALFGEDEKVRQVLAQISDFLLRGSESRISFVEENTKNIAQSASEPLA